jgi:ATP-dependent DNA helicase PIF1
MTYDDLDKELDRVFQELYTEPKNENIYVPEKPKTENKVYVPEEPTIPEVPLILERPVKKQMQLYELNSEQRAVIEEIDSGNNVFITGPGGTGKTFLIRHIRRHLEAKGKKVAITSLTGMASLLIGDGARTIHSWSGLGVGNRSVEESFQFIRVKHKKAREAWRETNTLIIDEISMMSDEYFEKLDAIAKLLRNSYKPFGGMQLLCFGDFYQLPPINTKFVFESDKWNEVLDSIVCLETIYRQKDPVFQKMLNEIRVGVVSNETDRLLKTRIGLDFSKEEIKPTKIFTRRSMVDKVNKEGLDSIDSPSKTYKICTKGPCSSTTIKAAIEKMDDSAQYEKELVLKVGAQVMLIANVNVEAGLVNGRLGIVKEFRESHTIVVEKLNSAGTLIKVPVQVSDKVVVRFKNGQEEEIGIHEWKLEGHESVSRNQIPLVLAYAITIHKSQGSTLDSAYIDIGTSVFEYGQAYVALSRVKNLDALYLHSYSRSSIRAHPKVVNYYESL